MTSGIPNGIGGLPDHATIVRESLSRCWDCGQTGGAVREAAERGLLALDALVAERDEERASERERMAGWQTAERLLAAAEDDRDRLATALRRCEAFIDASGLHPQLAADTRAALDRATTDA